MMRKSTSSRPSLSSSSRKPPPSPSTTTTNSPSTTHTHTHPTTTTHTTTTTTTSTLSGRLIAALDGLSDGVRCMAAAHNQIWCGGRRGQLLVYNATTRDTLLRTVAPGGDAVLCLLAVEERKQVWAGYASGSIGVWGTDHLALLFQIHGAHPGGVLCMALVPHSGNHSNSSGSNHSSGNGKSMVWTGGADFGVRMYDVASRQPMGHMKQHTNWVRCMVATPDGTVWTGSDDRSICVWGADSGELIAELKGHTDGVSCFCVAPVVDAITSHQSPTTPGHVPTTTYGVWSGSSDKTIRVWSPRTFKTVKEHRVHAQRLQALVCSGGEVWSAAADRTMCVFGARDYALRTVLREFDGWVGALALWGDRMWAGGADPLVKVFTCEHHKQKVAPPSGSAATAATHQSPSTVNSGVVIQVVPPPSSSSTSTIAATTDSPMEQQSSFLGLEESSFSPRSMAIATTSTPINTTSPPSPSPSPSPSPTPLSHTTPTTITTTSSARQDAVTLGHVERIVDEAMGGATPDPGSEDLIRKVSYLVSRMQAQDELAKEWLERLRVWGAVLGHQVPSTTHKSQSRDSLDSPSSSSSLGCEPEGNVVLWIREAEAVVDRLLRGTVQQLAGVQRTLDARERELLEQFERTVLLEKELEDSSASVNSSSGAPNAAAAASVVETCSVGVGVEEPPVVVVECGVTTVVVEMVDASMQCDVAPEEPQMLQAEPQEQEKEDDHYEQHHDDDDDEVNDEEEEEEEMEEFVRLMQVSNARAVELEQLVRHQESLHQQQLQQLQQLTMDCAIAQERARLLQSQLDDQRAQAAQMTDKLHTKLDAVLQCVQLSSPTAQSHPSPVLLQSPSSSSSSSASSFNVDANSKFVSSVGTSVEQVKEEAQVQVQTDVDGETMDAGAQVAEYILRAPDVPHRVLQAARCMLERVLPLDALESQRLRSVLDIRLSVVANAHSQQPLSTEVASSDKAGYVHENEQPKEAVDIEIESTTES